MLKSLIVLSAILTLSSALCPQNCNCSYDNAFECSLCVAASFRYYSMNDSDCYCIDSYVQMLPPQDSCRPANCSTYDYRGCVSCPTNWQLYSSDSITYVCVCKQNYELDANGTCVCKSGSAPWYYYGSVVRSYCKVCPSQCNCSSAGCYECYETAHRKISQEGNTSVCECSQPYVDIRGVCDAYYGCTISTNAAGRQVMECDSSSLREQLPNGVWSCISPYSDTDGYCWCASPLQELQIYRDNSNISTCACSSKVYPTLYTEYMSVCTLCPKGCVCSNFGCVSCDTASNRKTLGTGCPCKYPYVERQLQCVCMEPYYLANISGSVVCTCLKSDYVDLFYSDYSTGVCWRCPSGCQCDSSGCGSCKQQSLRLVEANTANTLYRCSKCDETAVMVDDVCVCPPFSSYSTGKCTCQVGTRVYKNLQDSRKCIMCPMECTCTALLGCSVCLPSANRNIVLTGTYNVCPCKTGFAENSFGVCQCTLPYTLNGTGSCVCDPPYELVNAVCQCKSIRAPTQYYYDSLTKLCYICPEGCICSSIGCISCGSDALRVIATTSAGKICPCQQTTVFNGDSCTYCSNNSMVVNGECVTCSDCATCDILGCRSCNSDATLIDHKCVCTNPSYININGKCVCSIEKYLNQSSSQCVDCPKQCHTCHLNSSGLFQCTSCRSEVNRINAVRNNCPCEDGFKESSPIDIFCCPSKCKTCDNTGCVTCSSMANRMLVGRDCVCLATYVDIGNGMCGCPSKSVSYGGTCLNCPTHCLECVYDSTSETLACLTCAENVNRDVNSSTCACLPNYAEADIEDIFCVPVFCLYYNSNTGDCTKCVFSRQIDENGGCVCPVHYYDTGSYGLCKECSLAIEGCIDCTSESQCLNCDQAQGYFLIAIGNSTFCKPSTNESNLHYIQTKDGILIQIKLNHNSSKFPTIKSVVATSYTVYSAAPNSTENSSITLSIQSSRKLNDNVIEIKILNPNNRSENQLLELKYTLINYTTRYLRAIYGVDSTGEFEGVEESSYIYQPLIYANVDVTLGNSWKYAIASIVVTVFMIVALIIYVLGFKHNQLLFFLQTMGLLAYTLDIAVYYEQATFTYALKAAYYQFGQQPSIAPIPDGYLQSSLGNFSYFQIDGNIFRVADILMVIAVSIAIIIGVFRAIYYLKERSRLQSIPIIHNLSKRTKKWIYRFLEFFYKTCMYPLLFFSIINLRNWNSTAMIGSYMFKVVGLTLSLFFIAAYMTVTLWQWCGQTTAKINRIENVSEFVTSFLAALTLAWTIERDLFLLLAVVFFLRGIVYIASRKILLRDFVNLDYMKALCVVFEVISLSLIKNRYLVVLVTFIFLTAVVQIAHEIVVLVFTRRRARLDKIKQEPRTEQATVEDTIVMMDSCASQSAQKEKEFSMLSGSARSGDSNMKVLSQSRQQSLVKMPDDEIL